MKAVSAAFLIMALGLGACAQTPPAPAAKTGDQKTVAATPPKPMTAPAPKKQAPPAVATIKPPILQEPEVVVGRSDAEIMKAFGDPNLRRKDSPAEVWQYLTPGCALHLFFYPGGSGDSLVVRYIAINGRSVASFSDLDRKQCFNDHLRAVGAEEAFIAKKAS